ncbi:serine/threonine protein kinase [Streptomyces sp. NPDC057939]|uniref:serine/threonine protein kinase n=1 Tax=Streptomyces sp. NPDC057939 TaxID=3346284 RepID=UPI0036E256AF
MTAHPILHTIHVPTLEPHLSRTGTIFRTFADQDSGCVSYGFMAAGRRWFVKGASTPDGVASLRRAVSLHGAVSHPAIVPLSHSFSTDEGLALVYPWTAGEVLYHPTRARHGGRAAPGSPLSNFRKLPLPRVHAALDSLLSAHLAVERAGFVAVDLYDGCMLYDFECHRLMLCDLDEYRPGPFTLRADRLPGSSRYMAPEEFVRGSIIDIRTTVFNLGRALRLLLDTGDEEGQWRGTPDQLATVKTATDPDPVRRFHSVLSLATAWHAADRASGAHLCGDGPTAFPPATP